MFIRVFVELERIALCVKSAGAFAFSGDEANGILHTLLILFKARSSFIHS